MSFWGTRPTHVAMTLHLPVNHNAGSGVMGVGRLLTRCCNARMRCYEFPSRKMHSMRRLLSLLGIAALIVAAVTPAGAQAPAPADPCSGYKWDVSAERTLFAAAPKPIAAGKDRASAGPAVANQLFTVTLHPLSEVSFPVTPARSPPAGSFAGLVELSIPAPGKYRVSVDVPLWIDVANGAALAPVLDYEGLHECSAPRKVVVFDLQGGKEWTLELSAADRAVIRLAVTPVR